MFLNSMANDENNFNKITQNWVQNKKSHRTKNLQYFSHSLSSLIKASKQLKLYTQSCDSSALLSIEYDYYWPVAWTHIIIGVMALTSVIWQKCCLFAINGRPIGELARLCNRKKGEWKFHKLHNFIWRYLHYWLVCTIVYVLYKKT